MASSQKERFSSIQSRANIALPSAMPSSTDSFGTTIHSTFGQRVFAVANLVLPVPDSVPSATCVRAGARPSVRFSYRLTCWNSLFFKHLRELRCDALP